jgi:hypothetical protein
LKNKKSIFTFFNLVLFISSLLFSTLNGFSAGKPNFHSHAVRHEVNASQSTDNGCSEMLFEKIENETEHDIHEQAILLPFSIAYFNLESPQFSRVHTQPIADKLSNPIYLSVCNFRI